MSATPHPSGPAREMLAPRHESLRKEFDNPLLPGYGEARLWIVARDPHWLFTYWEFNPTEHPGVRGADGTEHVFLRVTREDGAVVETTVEILPSVGHWYIPVSRADDDYSAELGYFTPGGVWAFVARSGAARTPPVEGLPRLGSGIRPPPPKPAPAPSGDPEWGAEEESMLRRLIAAESAKASGIRRPPKRTSG